MNKRKKLFWISTLLIISLVPQLVRAIEGEYLVGGVNSDGSVYVGKVFIKSIKGVFHVTWEYDDKLEVCTFDKHPYKLVAKKCYYETLEYIITPEGILIGVWDDGNAYETLVPIQSNN